MILHFSKLPTPTANKHPLLCYIYATCPVKGTWGDLRYYIGIEIISCPCYLLQWMATGGMSEWLTILSFKPMPAKKAPPKLFWPVFPNENCLINLSTEAFCVRVNTLHRIGLKQQSPRHIYPLTPFKTKSLGLSLPVAWQHIQLSVPKSI